MLDLEMEKTTTIPQPEDIPVELIQCIQSLLPFKEDARTCILSKSWLHAWSTISILKFLLPYSCSYPATVENVTKYKTLIHRTLQRYHRDNIPIECFHLQFNIFNGNQEEVSLAKTWIRQVVSKSCLKELSLKIGVFECTRLTKLPSELFSSRSLNTIYIVGSSYSNKLYPIRICNKAVIKCVSLRVLDLQDVTITEQILQNLLSTCSLLEKIKLLSCEGFKNVKVKNLLRLQEMDISLKKAYFNILEINNVPSLRSFCYFWLKLGRWQPMPFQMDTLTSVTQLHIEGVVMNNQFFDMVNSKFPLLESLTLGVGNTGLKKMVITKNFLCLSLKILVASVSRNEPLNAQVYAPRLLSFMYDGICIPSLTFPTIAPEKITLTLSILKPMNHSCFLKMRKILDLSSKIDFKIIHEYERASVNLDIDDLRRRVSVSVTDVQLSLETDVHVQWKDSLFFDAIFSICHPSYIKCEKRVIRKMMEAKTNDLKVVKVKNPHNGKWEALRSSWENVLETLAGPRYFECQLTWFAQ